MKNSLSDFGVKPGVVVNIGIKSGIDEFTEPPTISSQCCVRRTQRAFNPTQEPESALLLHQFGASIGGPILKRNGFTLETTKAQWTKSESADRRQPGHFAGRQGRP